MCCTDLRVKPFYICNSAPGESESPLLWPYQEQKEKHLKSKSIEAVLHDSVLLKTTTILSAVLTK